MNRHHWHASVACSPARPGVHGVRCGIHLDHSCFSSGRGAHLDVGRLFSQADERHFYRGGQHYVAPHTRASRACCGVDCSTVFSDPLFARLHLFRFRAFSHRRSGEFATVPVSAGMDAGGLRKARNRRTLPTPPTTPTPQPTPPPRALHLLARLAAAPKFPPLRQHIALLFCLGRRDISRTFSPAGWLFSETALDLRLWRFLRLLAFSGASCHRLTLSLRHVATPGRDGCGQHYLPVYFITTCSPACLACSGPLRERCMQHAPRFVTALGGDVVHG